MHSCRRFIDQKPTSFNPYLGSISLPSLPGGKCLLRFCVRDAYSAREDAIVAQNTLKAQVEGSEARGGKLMGVLMFGSMERGVKVFRYKVWCGFPVYIKYLLWVIFIALGLGSFSIVQGGPTDKFRQHPQSRRCPSNR